MKNSEVIPDLKGRKFNGNLSKLNVSERNRVSGYGSCCVPLFRSKFRAVDRNPVSKFHKKPGPQAAGFGFKSVHFLQKKWSKRKLGRALLSLPYASLRGYNLYSGYKLRPW
ncbi:hypothetical protein HDF18_01045 [Mucilaginibacter sp. X5P1]|uniref:hypothetical protein n=1 Tax=Mucilaginibacter sp. X5P1 TaxID=2723088 RepID=UPI0016175476|nr:hypothetical protein [Mucilaginibacter sp. X5P1]MBB6138316.1 hypothetical protein [Mucilaginibacter sp. X5P1]